MKLHINYELDLYNPPLSFDNHRWSALFESLSESMDIRRDAELSLTFTDNQTIHYLNQQYRQIDRPTDVLSFQQDLDNGLLGDIVISVEKAIEQAEEKKHSPEFELAFLATHGFLHLLGYDHMELEEEKVMFALQDDLMKQHFTSCFGEVK